MGQQVRRDALEWDKFLWSVCDGTRRCETTAATRRTGLQAAHLRTLRTSCTMENFCTRSWYWREPRGSFPNILIAASRKTLSDSCK